MQHPRKWQRSIVCLAAVLLASTAFVGLVLLRSLPWQRRCAHRGEAAPSTIHVAALVGDTTRVGYFLGEGLGVNARDREGRTPLYLAAREGHADTAAYLVARGAAHDLLTASGVGNLAVVKRLVARGSDVNAVEKCGGAPIHWAAENGHLSVVRFLLSKGARTDVRDWYYGEATPLHLAALWDHPDVIRLLAESGARIDARDEDGRTPIYLATEEGAMSAVEALIRLGAKVDARDQEGRTPLFAALERDYAANSILCEVPRILLAAHADPNTRADSGQGPLHVAVWYGHPEDARLLVRSGAKLDLYTAAGMGYVKALRTLISEGADVNARDGEGYYPLHWAAKCGQRSATAILLQEGAHVDPRSRDGVTPLHLAMSGALPMPALDPLSRLGEGHRRRAFRDTAELLVSSGANARLKDPATGSTPMKLAAEIGDRALLKLMRQGLRKR